MVRPVKLVRAQSSTKPDDASADVDGDDGDDRAGPYVGAGSNTTRVEGSILGFTVRI